MNKQDHLNCVGKGWHKIVEPLLDQAEKEGIAVVQVKEKFGTLRFYTNSCNESLDAEIEKAERASACTCEACGEPGAKTSSRRGWIKTLCETCR